jgi:hypothetical protein
LGIEVERHDGVVVDTENVPECSREMTEAEIKVIFTAHTDLLPSLIEFFASFLSKTLISDVYVDVYNYVIEFPSIFPVACAFASRGRACWSRDSWSPRDGRRGPFDGITFFV